MPSSARQIKALTAKISKNKDTKVPLDVVKKTADETDGKETRTNKTEKKFEGRREIKE